MVNLSFSISLICPVAHFIPVGNARIEGLAADTHMSMFLPGVHSWRDSYHRSKQAGNQYLTTLTIYFIGYVLFEVPCNIVLRLTSPRFWLPTLTLVWGIVCTLMGLTQNFAGFLAVRFFLGIAESGFAPGVVFYLSMWYKRNEQHYRIALFVSAATLAGAFGGLFVSYHRVSSSVEYSQTFRRLPLPK